MSAGPSGVESACCSRKVFRKLCSEPCIWSTCRLTDDLKRTHVEKSISSYGLCSVYVLAASHCQILHPSMKGR